MLDTRPRGVTVLRFCLHVNMIHNPSLLAYDVCTARRRGLSALLSPRWRAGHGAAHMWRHPPRIPPYAAACRIFAGRDPDLLTAVICLHITAPVMPGDGGGRGLPAAPRRHYISIIMGAGRGGIGWGRQASTEHPQMSRMPLAALAQLFPPRPGARGKSCVLDLCVSTLAAWGLPMPDRRARGNPPGAQFPGISDAGETLPPPPTSRLSIRGGGGARFSPAPYLCLYPRGAGEKLPSTAHTFRVVGLDAPQQAAAITPRRSQASRGVYCAAARPLTHLRYHPDKPQAPRPGGALCRTAGGAGATSRATQTARGARALCAPPRGESPTGRSRPRAGRPGGAVCPYSYLIARLL